MLLRSYCLFLALVAMLAGAEVPAGTSFQVRLRNKVDSTLAKAKQPVEAVVITPVIAGDQTLIATGTLLRGEVRKAVAADETGQTRAQLELDFNQIQEPTGKPARIVTRIVRVDNARESVDEAGRILGIVANQTLGGRMEQGIGKIAQSNPRLAEFLGMAKGAFVNPVDPQIVYEPGTELNIETTKAFAWTATLPSPALTPVSDEAGLYQLVNRQPFRTEAEKPPAPSDLTNLMFVGTQEEIEAAFKEAGWTKPAALSTESGLETMRAIVELRGYKEAPMSVLLLSGEPAALDYQKQLNTFAARHHLRIWRRAETFQDKPVWVASSTHDTGIAFSEENRTFIHTVDSEIDKERAKIVSDLLFTGRVRSLALVQRPDVPRRARNATGDELLTDGRMAVVILGGTSTPWPPR